MAKTRGAHSFRPRVCQGPSSPAAGPILAAAGSSTTDIAAAGPTSATGPAAAGPSTAAAGTDPSAPAVRPTSAPVVVPAGDAEGSSSVAPTQRRYHTRVGPTPPAPSHPKPARRAPPAKMARTSDPGSHLHRDPGRRPLHLISVLPEPQTYLRGPSSGDLTFPTTPSRGMLATGIEIFIGRCIMISRHFLQTQVSETP